MAKGVKTERNKSLKSRFRFVVLNDETFEEKFSLTLTRTNVWVFVSVTAFTVVFLTAAAIIYTPLKYFIPGFGDYNYRGQILQLQFKADSLEQTLQGRQLWLENVINIAQGNIDSSKPAPTATGKIDKSAIDLTEIKPDEKQLREEVAEDESFSLSGKSNAVADEVRQKHFISPVEGYVTDEYNATKQHYGIDIATKADEPVKSVLDGKVVSAEYSLQTGWVIAVQHTDNLLSFYKHNATLTKKAGDHVKAGEVIAIAGKSGELATGPHLHFELWCGGKSLNPKDYIVF